VSGGVLPLYLGVNHKTLPHSENLYRFCLHLPCKAVHFQDKYDEHANEHTRSHRNSESKNNALVIWLRWPDEILYNRSGFKIVQLAQQGDPLLLYVKFKFLEIRDTELSLVKFW
jgi:hypothetical protein